MDRGIKNTGGKRFGKKKDFLGPILTAQKDLRVNGLLRRYIMGRVVGGIGSSDGHISAGSVTVVVGGRF